MAPAGAFRRIFAAVLLSWTSTRAGAGLHPGSSRQEQRGEGLGLRRSGGKLVVEGEGLDGERGGTLVLPVAHHRWAAVGTAGGTTCRGRQTQESLYTRLQRRYNRNERYF